MQVVRVEQPQIARRGGGHAGRPPVKPLVALEAQKDLLNSGQLSETEKLQATIVISQGGYVAMEAGELVMIHPVQVASAGGFSDEQDVENWLMDLGQEAILDGLDWLLEYANSEGVELPETIDRIMKSKITIGANVSAFVGAGGQAGLAVSLDMTNLELGLTYAGGTGYGAELGAGLVLGIEEGSGVTAQNS